MPEALTARRPERPPTPEWLVRGEPAMCPCGCSGRRKKGSFVEKTLNGGAALIRQVMFGEDVAAQAGLLQRLDPRAKVVGLVVLLVSASLLHNIASLVAMYLLTLVVAAAFFVTVFLKESDASRVPALSGGKLARIGCSASGARFASTWIFASFKSRSGASGAMASVVECSNIRPSRPVAVRSTDRACTPSPP